jgi:hypothetical protein
VFAGQTAHSLGKCGDLVFRNEEWAALRDSLAGLTDIECVPESGADLSGETAPKDR